jgi:hypothetical protein
MKPGESTQPQWGAPQQPAWQRVKEALRRDWVQTKADFGLGGSSLGHGLGDTLKQAVGATRFPAPVAMVSAAEPAVAIDAGAHRRHRAVFEAWNGEIELEERPPKS